MNKNFLHLTSFIPIPYKPVNIKMFKWLNVFNINLYLCLSKSSMFTEWFCSKGSVCPIRLLFYLLFGHFLKLHLIFPNIVYTLNPIKFVIIHKVIRQFFKLIVLIKGYIILILLLLYCTLSAIGCTAFSTLI